MFNLEQSITEWRRQMLNAGIKTPVPMEELESHLREDIDNQVRAGASAQQAFDAAVLGIGRAGLLRREFAKVDVVGQALKRKLVWVFSCIAKLLGRVWQLAGPSAHVRRPFGRACGRQLHRSQALRHSG
jgi:hypothetical protein